MAFNRHEILKKHYANEIRQWDWDWVGDRFDRNSRDKDCYDIQDDDKFVYVFIGGVMSLMPSGKIYAFWTSNQTNSDVTRDQAWYEALEEICEEHGCFQCTPDGASGDDIFLCKRFDVEVEEGVE